MCNAWKQREKRDGIKLVWLNHELPENNDEVIVKAFKDAMTERTKVVHITHVVNWVGQIMPVRKIADEAHKRGLEVLVDGAHSFAQINYNIADLGADYFGTSLHKWLCAPLGSGMLYIKKDKIKNIWSMMSNDKPDGDDIRKFESLGTRNMASEMAIGAAIDFHEAIGSERKEQRLRYLQKYWTDRVKSIPGVKIHHPSNDAVNCAIGNFSVEGMKLEDIDSQLFGKYKIHTVAINWENIHGIRVTPNVYTSTKDLDKLIHAIEEITKKSRN
jgi:selenocysteine lyase/cysteine desulfurase